MKDQKPASLKDVAKHAKVSLATIDRVIHGRSGVSTKTRERVLKSILELNYQPNILASNLSKKKIYVFGVLLPKSSNGSTYWDLPIVGIQKALKEIEQYAIKIEIFLYDRDDKKDIRKQILKIINSSIDGLVLTPKFAEETEILIQDCSYKDRPYVFIDSNIQEKNSLCSIEQPLYESGQLAAQLFSYGFDQGKILILHFKDAMDSEMIIKTKLKGVQDFVKESGSRIQIDKLVMTDFCDQNIKTNMDKILDKNPDIKGVFIPNSKINYIARYLESRRGDKIYLVGYDYLKENLKYMENGIIDFLICQKPELQGYNAIYKLFDFLVLRKKVDEKVIMPLDIVTKINHMYY